MDLRGFECKSHLTHLIAVKSCLLQPIFYSHVQVKAHYNTLMDTMKQTSFQNMQGEPDTVESMSGKFRAQQAQQALSLHKVDMEASVMEVSCGEDHE